VREIPQNLKCLKKEISTSFFQFYNVYSFPPIFLTLSERGGKLLSQFLFKERGAV